MKITKKIGLIGCGNMGSAILEGAFRKQLCSPSQVWVADKMTDKVRVFSMKNGSHFAKDAVEVAQKTDVILLAVKPQDLTGTAAVIRPLLNSKKIVISILAGVKLAGLKKHLGKAALVRAMPNLGAQVGESITAICSANRDALKIAQALFSACGRVVLLDEEYFDVVTAVSGSGPAYFFLMMELLQTFAEKSGMDTKSARELAVQTALAAGKLAVFSSDSPAVLRERVTSKKGTTDAALSVLKSSKFPNLFFKALQAAVKRSQQLSK